MANAEQLELLKTDIEGWEGLKLSKLYSVYQNSETVYSDQNYPAGEYAIVKASIALSDVFLTNNDKWATSDAITQNASSYRIGADCGNGTLTFYVDGKQIDSVSDSTYTSGGVGLFAWSGEETSGTDVTFDDFVMTKLGQ